MPLAVGRNSPIQKPASKRNETISVIRQRCIIASFELPAEAIPRRLLFW